MELKSFVQCMIIIFTIAGTNGRVVPVSDICEMYTKLFCECSEHDQLLGPLKMCSNTDAINDLCKPCSEEYNDLAQNNATCAACPEIECPQCNMSSGLTHVLTTLSAVEDEHGLRNHSVVKRSQEQRHEWCRIDNELMSGELTCKIWKHKKECELNCSEEDGPLPKFTHYFICYRDENNWYLQVEPCDDGENENVKDILESIFDFMYPLPTTQSSVLMPIKHYVLNGGVSYHHARPYVISRKEYKVSDRQLRSYHGEPRWFEKRVFEGSHTDLSPQSAITTGPSTSSRLFMPVRHVGKRHEYPSLPRVYLRMDSEVSDMQLPPYHVDPLYHVDPRWSEKTVISPPMSSSDDFDPDDEVISQYPKMRFQFYDELDDLVDDVESAWINMIDSLIWMVSNELSISYAPYKDDPEAMFQEETFTDELF